MYLNEHADDYVDIVVSLGVHESAGRDKRDPSELLWKLSKNYFLVLIVIYTKFPYLFFYQFLNVVQS
jgi:hypothetical protein